MYLVFTRVPGESYRRRLRSLLLYLCYVFRTLINSLVCWFCTSALGLVLFQICFPIRANFLTEGRVAAFRISTWPWIRFTMSWLGDLLFFPSSPPPPPPPPRFARASPRDRDTFTIRADVVTDRRLLPDLARASWPWGCFCGTRSTICSPHPQFITSLCSRRIRWSWSSSTYSR